VVLVTLGNKGMDSLTYFPKYSAKDSSKSLLLTKCEVQNIF